MDKPKELRTDEFKVEQLPNHSTNNTRIFLLPILIGILTAIGIVTIAMNNTKYTPNNTSPIDNPSTGRYTISDRQFVDPLDQQVHEELQQFIAWANAADAEVFVGEVGWPDTRNPDYNNWKQLADNWLLDISQTDIPVVYWAAGRHWGSEYPLSAYETIDDKLTRQNAQAVTFEKQLKTKSYGINLAGLEFGSESAFSAVEPGVEGINYFKTNTDDFAFLAKRGYKFIRLPFRWERLQPVLNGNLDSAYLAYLEDAVTAAHANDMTIILDMHNYGEYKTTSDNTLYLGEELQYDHFNSVWVALSRHFRNSPAKIYYGLMNEPRNLPSGSAESPEKNWEQASQSALQAIRSDGDTRPILVAGYNWSKIKSWPKTHPKAWISDPARNFFYEGHHYWDADETGTYQKSYNESVEKSKSNN